MARVAWAAGQGKDERPAIVVVEPDGDTMRRMTDELGRYERDYRIVSGRLAVTSTTSS